MATSLICSAHQILKPIRKYKRKIPTYLREASSPCFIFSDDSVRTFLRATFPRLGEQCLVGCSSFEKRTCRCIPCKEFQKAAMWAVLLRRYYLDGESLTTCAHELCSKAVGYSLYGVTYESDEAEVAAKKKRLQKELQYLRRAVLGLRMDGKAGGLKKRGRPRKINQIGNNGGNLNLFRQGIVPHDAQVRPGAFFRSHYV